jgi:hypothetical protein
MDKILAAIPKNTLAFLAIVGGIIFIILAEPPKSVCDAQIEVIKKSQQKFLYKDPKSKMVKTTRYQTRLAFCKDRNDPGACYELFHDMRSFLRDLSNVPTDCSGAVGAVSEFKKAMWDSMTLIVQLAWGDKPPASYNAKFGWLDTADITLYCQLKNSLQMIYGETAWDNYREKMMKELPGAKELPRNQVWDMALFSENCARYP